MKRHIFGTDNLDRWKEYYQQLPKTSPYHSPSYLDFLSGNFEFDAEQAELFVLDGEKGFVYYPYLRRPLTTLSFDHPDYELTDLSDIVSSWYYGGPLYAGSEDARARLTSAFAEEFSTACRERGIVAEFIRFDPNIRNDQSFAELDPQLNRETVPVDLTKSKDALWNEFEKRNRNAIRQAQKTEIVVESTQDSTDYEAFYEIYTNAMDARDASTHYRFPYSFFADLFERDWCTVTVARYDDTVIGGSVVVHDDRIAHDYLRASNPDYWDMRVNNLLCYETLLEIRSRGIETFDFQGGRPGVFNFKKSFSPDRGQFHIARRVHDQDVYDDLVARAAECGIDTDGGYFPAYRVEQS